MLTLMAVLSTVPASREMVASLETCQVGIVALKDLPAYNANHNNASYYASPDTSRTDLLDVCPKLRRDVPKEFPFPDNEERTRAKFVIPIRGHKSIPPNTMIFAIDPPRISADGKSAIVTMRYECSGLCGGHTVFHYTHDRKGWRKVSSEIPSVS